MNGRAAILCLWGVIVGTVLAGSLLPANIPLMVAIGRLKINDKILHFCAYFALAFLPMIGFQDRRRSYLVGVSMFALGLVLELGQYFAPGRAAELADVAANGLGIGCGTLMGILVDDRIGHARTDPPPSPE